MELRIYDFIVKFTPLIRNVVLTQSFICTKLFTESNFLFHSLNKVWGKSDGCFSIFLKCVEGGYRFVISSVCYICICFGSFFFLRFAFKVCLSRFNRLFCLFYLCSMVLVLCFSFIKSFLCIYLSLFAFALFFDSFVLFSFSVSKTFAIESLLCVFYFGFSISDTILRLSHFCLFCTNRFALNSDITVCIIFFSLRSGYRLFFGRNTCFCSFNCLLSVLNRFRCCFVSSLLSIRLSLFQISNFLFCLVRSVICLIQDFFCFVRCFLGLFSSSTKFSNILLSRSFHFHFLRRFFLYQSWLVFSSCRDVCFSHICLSSSDCSDKSSCCDCRNNRTRIHFFSSTMTIFCSS